jgi:hypothetical protein
MRTTGKRLRRLSGLCVAACAMFATFPNSLAQSGTSGSAGGVGDVQGGVPVVSGVGDVKGGVPLHAGGLGDVKGGVPLRPGVIARVT